MNEEKNNLEKTLEQYLKDNPGIFPEKSTYSFGQLEETVDQYMEDSKRAKKQLELIREEQNIGTYLVLTYNGVEGYPEGIYQSEEGNATVIVASIDKEGTIVPGQNIDLQEIVRFDEIFVYGGPRSVVHMSPFRSNATNYEGIRNATNYEGQQLDNAKLTTISCACEGGHDWADHWDSCGEDALQISCRTSKKYLGKLVSRLLEKEETDE
jgi:hypothetical protein